jgi:integrase
MPISDAQLRAFRPRDKAFKIFDGGGLYVEVTPSGGKLWRLKYRFEGKEQRLALGAYPDVPLKDARSKRDDARRELAAGRDPGVQRKLEKALKAGGGTSFEAVAIEWLEKFSAGWAPITRKQAESRLRNMVFPQIGKMEISSIKPLDVLAVLRRIEEREALETAHRVRQRCSEVFRYAVATGRAERDVTADLRGAVPPPQVTHMPTLTDPKAVGSLLRAIDGYDGELTTRCALRLAPLVFVRPGELRSAEWAELNLEDAEWNIPAAKMKMREPHLVPLARQAIAIFQELQPLTGRGRYVFPSARTTERPMSDAAINAALRRMGYLSTDITSHGFRAMARTMLDEVLGVAPHLIEHQLAHAVKDPLGRAYNRTKHLPDRRDMMQRWADYLDQLKSQNTACVAG